MASDVDNVCASDPNYAAICSFVDQFGDLLGLGEISFSVIKSFLENSSEVDDNLKQLLIRLLRRAGLKTVNVELWQKSLIKFLHRHSQLDAWEVERFGFAHSDIATKIRVVKLLLEAQFDKNVKFKERVNERKAPELRLKPVGRDKNGMAYWYMLDKEANLLVYREEQDCEDKEGFKLVCTNRDDLASLIVNLQEKSDEISLKSEDTQSVTSTSSKVSELKDEDSVLPTIKEESTKATSEGLETGAEQSINGTDPGDAHKVETETKTEVKEEIKGEVKVKVKNETEGTKSTSAECEREEKEVGNNNSSPDQESQQCEKPDPVETSTEEVKVAEKKAEDKESNLPAESDGRAVVETREEVENDSAGVENGVGEEVSKTDSACPAKVKEKCVETPEAEEGSAKDHDECAEPLDSTVLDESESTETKTVAVDKHETASEDGAIVNAEVETPVGSSESKVHDGVEENGHKDAEDTDKLSVASEKVASRRAPSPVDSEKIERHEKKLKRGEEAEDEIPAKARRTSEGSDDPPSIVVTDTSNRERVLLDRSRKKGAEVEKAKSDETPDEKEDSEKAVQKADDKANNDCGEANGTKDDSKDDKSDDDVDDGDQPEEKEHSELNEDSEQPQENGTVSVESTPKKGKRKREKMEIPVEHLRRSSRTQKKRKILDDEIENIPPVKASRKNKHQSSPSKSTGKKRRGDRGVIESSSDSDVPLSRIRSKRAREKSKESGAKCRKLAEEGSKKKSKRKKAESDEEFSLNGKKKKGRKRRKSSDQSSSSSEFLEESESEELVFGPSSDENELDEESDTDYDPTSVKKGRNARRQEARQDKSAGAEEEKPCELCQKHGHPEWILLCDQCDDGYHTTCLRPPLMLIPEGDWYCPPCEHKRLIDTLSDRLKLLDQELKKREHLVIRKERLAFVNVNLDNILKDGGREEVVVSKMKKKKKKKKNRHRERSLSPVNRRSRRIRERYISEDEESEDSYEEELVYTRSTRRRKEINYHFDDYDQLIEEAIGEEVKAVESCPKPGPKPGRSRGKDMANIEGMKEIEDDRPPGVMAGRGKRRGRRLTCLDVDNSNEEDSDEYKASDDSVSDVESEDEFVDEEDDDDGGSLSGNDVRSSRRMSGRKQKGGRFAGYRRDGFVVDSDADSDLRPARRSRRIRVNYRDVDSDTSDEITKRLAPKKEKHKHHKKSRKSDSDFHASDDSSSTEVEEVNTEAGSDNESDVSDKSPSKSRKYEDDSDFEGHISNKMKKTYKHKAKLFKKIAKSKHSKRDSSSDESESEDNKKKKRKNVIESDSDEEEKGSDGKEKEGSDDKEEEGSDDKEEEGSDKEEGSDGKADDSDSKEEESDSKETEEEEKNTCSKDKSKGSEEVEKEKTSEPEKKVDANEKNEAVQKDKDDSEVKDKDKVGSVNKEENHKDNEKDDSEEDDSEEDMHVISNKPKEKPAVVKQERLEKDQSGDSTTKIKPKEVEKPVKSSEVIEKPIVKTAPKEVEKPIMKTNEKETEKPAAKPAPREVEKPTVIIKKEPEEATPDSPEPSRCAVRMKMEKAGVDTPPPAQPVHPQIPIIKPEPRNPDSPTVPHSPPVRPPPAVVKPEHRPTESCSGSSRGTPGHRSPSNDARDSPNIKPLPGSSASQYAPPQNPGLISYRPQFGIMGHPQTGPRPGFPPHNFVPQMPPNSQHGPMYQYGPPMVPGPLPPHIMPPGVPHFPHSQPPYAGHLMEMQRMVAPVNHSSDPHHQRYSVDPRLPVGNGPYMPPRAPDSHVSRATPPSRGTPPSDAQPPIRAPPAGPVKNEEDLSEVTDLLSFVSGFGNQPTSS